VWPSTAALPHFLVLGTQKGGTTSLHALLGQHPEVYLPACKEVQYFSLHAHRPPRWYGAHYAESRADQLRGDVTPYYLFHPEAAERIHKLLPEARLIVLLRDPVERSLSQYFHARRLGFEDLGLEEALARESERLRGAEMVVRAPSGRHRSHQKHSYVSRSLYAEQLRRYEERFPPHQLLVLRSEDFFERTPEVWDRILRFLTLPVLPLPAGRIRANAGSGEAEGVPPSIRDALRIRLAPTARTMRERYGFDWGW
jgi:hypothetical protein